MTTATVSTSKTTNGSKADGKSPLDAKQLVHVIDAMRDVQTEGDRWHLAEELKVLVPAGNNDGFGEIIDRATAEGVVGNLSVTTLRLYRDTAIRWPEEKRIQNMSFSAHREAMRLPTIDQAVKMLNDLAKSQGAGNVSVASVRKAVAIKQGKKPTTKTGQSPTSKGLDVIRDLTTGGSELIKVIGNESDADKLDKLDAGLKKVMAHVERLRAKAARAKAKTAAKPSADAKPATPPTTKPSTSPKKSAGDMRGL